MFKKIDENQKSKVLEFDKQKDSYEALMYKIVVGIFSVCLVLGSLLKGKEMMYGLIFAFSAVNFMIMQYVYTKDRKNNSNRGTSVYNIIKYAPIDRDVYVSVRMQYIVKFFTKVLVAAFMLKVIVMLIEPAAYGIQDFIITFVTVFAVPVVLGYIELKQALK